MIDLHCHILPGIGDGPTSIDESIKMLKQAKDNSIKEIVCVCHYEPDIASSISQAKKTLSSNAQQLDITLYSAVEYNYSDLLQDKIEYHPIGNSNYILIDFFSSHIPFSTPQKFFDIMRNGYYPIIVHPEKLFSIKKTTELEKLVNQGAIIQVNSDSFFSKSSKIRRFSHYLIRMGMVSVIASDAHNTGCRKNTMLACRNLITEKYGPEFAELLFSTNPQLIISNKIPEQLPTKLNFLDKSRLFLSRISKRILP